MIEAILKGLALGVVLALSVGPIIFTIIKQSLNHGHRGGFSFVVGVWISDLLLVVLSNVFTSWVAMLLEYRRMIAFFGSLFLLSMGIYFVFFKRVVLRPTDDADHHRFSPAEMYRTAASGFLINTLNPGVIVFWLGNATVLSISHSLQQRIVIFLVCLLVNMSADVGKVMMAGKLRSRLTVHNLSIINRISGLILIGFGLFVLVGAIFHPKI